LERLVVIVKRSVDLFEHLDRMGPFNPVALALRSGKLALEGQTFLDFGRAYAELL
jgi:hypothetical protein